MKNKGLGRGLDALLDNDNTDEMSQNLMNLNIDEIEPGEYQPRKKMDEQGLVELSESIRSQGIMQPILVRKKNNGRYEIIAGERRWQASKKAGMKEIPVLIKEISDSSALAMALIENIQREDLNIIEEAQGIKRLLEEFKMTHEEAAVALGKSRVAVSNILRLLNLSNYVQNLLLENKIEMGHARALISLSSDEQAMLCQKIILLNLTVRDVEKIVAGEGPNKKNEKKDHNQDLVNLENEVSEKIGMKVSINHKTKGNGILKIDYPNIEQLQAILKKLK